MAWKKVVRFAQGTSHKKQGIGCQDYGKYCIIGDAIIGAVADGAGSAKYSRVGARLAVVTALKYLRSAIIEFKETRYRDKKYQSIESLENQGSAQEKCNADLSEEEAKNLFTETVKKAIAALKNTADKNGYSPNELACTLLVFVATPNWIAAMQIGDGFIIPKTQSTKCSLSQTRESLSMKQLLLLQPMLWMKCK